MIELRLARLEDFDLFYSMKSDSNNISWGGFTEAPNRDNFFLLYKKLLEPSSQRLLFLLWDETTAVGYCSLDFNTSQEISYGVLTQYAGNGYGTKIVNLVEKYCSSPIIEAWVAQDNIGSIRCFQKNGYTQTKDCTIRSLPLLGGNREFYKWIKEL